MIVVKAGSAHGYFGQIFDYINKDTHMARKKQELINKKCMDCCFDPADSGTWREQVERNPCGNCPLAEVKPKTIATERMEARLRLVSKKKAA